MEIWLWSVIVLLSVIVLILIWKICMFRKSIREIETSFAEKIEQETNTPICISSNDAVINHLAASLNEQLSRLREKELRFAQGDQELKNAITNISHDLRTPLTAICAYLELSEQEEKSENCSRYLAIIRDRAELMTKLTEELFRYSVVLAENGQQERKEEPVVVNAVLEESIAAFYTVFTERGIVPDIAITNEKVVRNLDPSALSRIFSNLLNNALKYSDGDLNIRMTPDGTITFTNSAEKLDEIQVGKLFDRFYTVEAARKSTGLGLSIARTLAEQMHGTVSASYAEGKLSMTVRL